MNVRKIIKNSTIALALSAGLLASAAQAEVVFESTPVVSSGFSDYRDGGSAAVGRVTATTTQEINQIGVLNWLLGTGTQDLKFFIADATTGSMYYLSSAQTFSNDGSTGPASTSDLNYKLSDAFSFTFNAGVTYAVGYISSGANYTYADFYQTNSANGFTSLLGNVNVSNFTDPTLNPSNACCSIGFELNTIAAVTAVPEPETYAMLLAGLGMVGFMARRRKTS